jgi:hypothetical protein
MSKFLRILIIGLLSLSILSCGGEAIISAGISGTGIVYGVINGFGSIFVNGVEYDIDQASIDVDGSPSVGQNKLALGMVVRLDATDNGDGTGLATTVIYDDAIEGPIEGAPVLSTTNKNLKTLNILGQTVLIDAASTTFTIDNGTVFSFDTIASGDVVEVSGFTDFNSSMIIATRVEKKVGQQNAPVVVELHGVIDSVGTDTITVQGVTVDIASIGDSDLTDLDRQGLKVGVHVEVNGFYLGPLSIQASHIEGEDDDLQKLTSATGLVSLQGIVSEYTHGDDYFKLNGIVVDISGIASSITMLLKEGIQVQVKGQYAGTDLIAQELAIRSGDAEFDAVVSSIADIASKRIQIEYPGLDLFVDLLFDSQSQLVDESTHHHSSPLTLDNLSVDDEVKVQVKRVGNDWVVVSLKRDNLNQYKIRGYITAKNVADYTVTVNDLTVALSASADYEIADHNSNQQGFFNAIDESDPSKNFVDIEGSVLNGTTVFDEIELDPNH